MTEEYSSEKNKAIVQRMNQEVWEKGNLEYLNVVIAPHYVNRTAPPGRPTGPQGFRPGAIRAAFPDAYLNVEDMIAEGDRVVTRYSIRGTHIGTFAGIRPSGRRVTIRGITIFRLEGGQIVESWSHWDDIGLLRQLGALDDSITGY